MLEIFKNIAMQNFMDKRKIVIQPKTRVILIHRT
jgi:hypothetical protein